MEYTKIKWRARTERLLLHNMIKAKQCFIDFSWKTEFEAKKSRLVGSRSYHAYDTKHGKNWYVAET